MLLPNQGRSINRKAIRFYSFGVADKVFPQAYLAFCSGYCWDGETKNVMSHGNFNTCEDAIDSCQNSLLAACKSDGGFNTLIGLPECLGPIGGAGK